MQSGPKGNSKVWVKSNKAYAEQGCARQLFRPDLARRVGKGKYLRDVWKVDDAGFAQALDFFLDNVKVETKQTEEGAIQARWTQVREPWIVFEREAVLTYPSKTERSRFLADAFRPAVDEAVNRSLPNRRRYWAKLPKRKTSLKLDALAVHPEGNLVLVEIKDATGKAKEVYYSPYQLLHNVWEWHQSLPAVRASIQELLDVKVQLGLTLEGLPKISGGIRAVVGFGEDEPNERVWYRYLEVLGTAGSLLPPGLSPIEAWTLTDGTPVRLV